MAEGRETEPSDAEEEDGRPCSKCRDRQRQLDRLVRIQEKTADALRESQVLLRSLQPDNAPETDWAMLYKEMVQSNHALQTHLSEANRSNKELRSQLDKSAELVARANALQTENELLRGDTSDALQQILSALAARPAAPPPSQPKAPLAPPLAKKKTR